MLTIMNDAMCSRCRITDPSVRSFMTLNSVAPTRPQSILILIGPGPPPGRGGRAKLPLSLDETRSPRALSWRDELRLVLKSTGLSRFAVVAADGREAQP